MRLCSTNNLEFKLEEETHGEELKCRFDGLSAIGPSSKAVRHRQTVPSAKKLYFSTMYTYIICFGAVKYKGINPEENKKCFRRKQKFYLRHYT